MALLLMLCVMGGRLGDSGALWRMARLKMDSPVEWVVTGEWASAALLLGGDKIGLVTMRINHYAKCST